MSKSVEYLFYANEFQGEALPETIFYRYEIKARYFIDSITFGRTHNKELSNEVKLAICAVAEKLRKLDVEGGIKSSETVGKKSISYHIGNIESVESILYKEAYIYLANTRLLYRGVD